MIGITNINNNHSNLTEETTKLPSLYRRQFLLSSRPLHIKEAWPCLIVGHKYYLYVHPDLNLTTVNHNNNELVLLGYILNPKHPEWDNKQILFFLLKQCKTKSDIFELSREMGGRWILILYQQNQVILFHDPAGLRQVIYTNADITELWCASQEHLLTKYLSLETDSEAADFRRIYFSQNNEYWWPAGSTLYKSLRRLLPNHYLDLANRRAHRFFPCKVKSTISFDDAVEQAGWYLKQLITAAANRFPLALPITAGLDSRTLLAATKQHQQDIFYYTLQYRQLTPEHNDIRIPALLLNKLGLKHHILPCPKMMSERFRERYQDNVADAHEAWGAIAEGILQNYPQQRVALKGSCSEIAQCEFFHYGYPQIVNDTYLTGLFSGLSSQSFARKQYSAWLSDVQNLDNDYNYRLLDLFYWEDRMGCWQAQSQLEWDMVQEEFSPFNCRALLDILLSLDDKYRRPPHFLVYRQIIHNLWPEVLNFPINPFTFKQWVKKKLLFCLGKTGMLHITRMYLQK